MASWDAIVIGLGGVGSAATYRLAKAGLRVLGIDQFPPGHDRGSSHGKTRIIRQAYFEHPCYVPLLRRAYQLWDEVEQEANTQLFYRTGLVELGPPDGVVIPGVLRSAAEYDLEIEQLSVAEVSQRWRGIAGEPHWQAVIERDAGFLRVEACVEAHQQLAHRAGATCVYGAEVQQWVPDGQGVTVTTDQGTERAERLVIAGGPWSAALLGDAPMKLQVTRKHQYWYRAGVEGFELADGFPCFFHETSTGFYYGFPSIDGSGVKVARHSGGELIDGPEASHPEDSEDRRLVEEYVRLCLPGVGDELLQHAGCYYTVTPDEHFLIDHHPDHSQVTIVAGLSGHGFKFTSALGELASQLAMSEKPDYDITPFAVGRSFHS